MRCEDNTRVDFLVLPAGYYPSDATEPLTFLLPVALCAMSSDEASDVASYIAYIESIIIGNYCEVGASVFFLYDCIITFPREKELYWRRPLSRAATLFFSVKYLEVIRSVLTLVSYSGMTLPSDESCAALQRAIVVTIALSLLSCALFSGMRAYALSRSWWFSAIISILATAPVGFNLTPFGYGLRGANAPGLGCLSYMENDDPKDNLIFTVMSRTSNIVADIMLILMTWATIWRSNGGLLPAQQSLTGIFLRDGAVYFIVLLCLNVSHLAFSVRSIFGDEGGSYVTIFTEPVTVTLVVHFLLNLQEANRNICKLASDNVLHFSSETLSFACNVNVNDSAGGGDGDGPETDCAPVGVPDALPRDIRDRWAETGTTAGYL